MHVPVGAPTHEPVERGLSRDRGAWPVSIEVRTVLGFGCPIEEQENGQRERRKKVNAKGREDRAPALDALAWRRATNRGK